MGMNEYADQEVADGHLIEVGGKNYRARQRHGITQSKYLSFAVFLIYKELSKSQRLNPFPNPSLNVRLETESESLCFNIRRLTASVHRYTQISMGESMHSGQLSSRHAMSSFTAHIYDFLPIGVSYEHKQRYRKRLSAKRRHRAKTATEIRI
jgi:hypothetical protein